MKPSAFEKGFSMTFIHEGLHGVACISGGVQHEFHEGLHGLACISSGIIIRCCSLFVRGNLVSIIHGLVYYLVRHG